MFRVVCRPVRKSFAFAFAIRCRLAHHSDHTYPASLCAARPAERSLSSKMSARQYAKSAAAHGAYHNNGRKDATDCTSYWDDPESMERNREEYKKFLVKNRKALQTSQDEQHSDVSGGQKRAGDQHSSHPGRPSKKQTSIDGKQNKPSSAAGSITRVPKKGQSAQWYALPGWIDGEVVEVLYEQQEVDGKKVKASREDPRIVLKSAASGRICVHKPEAVHFD
ncbi:predicted protein [Plenodomus lingam JN3]|uniref:Predicted protein n=2 Tax=Leptosphaeria maculans TaxID=5022 RepID=E4ZVP9_LEPMJ|nr:predicted protein [Plenodomus lingam JN3]CBX95675.1 predicted protein [Plenodomus lingam JN3]